MNSGNNGVPGWLIFVGSTAVALGVTVTISVLLILGRPVPQELWLVMTAISVAYFGSGPFLGMLTHTTNASHQLLDTVNHGLAVVDRSIQAIQTMAGTTNATGGGTNVGTSAGTQGGRSSQSGGNAGGILVGGGE